MRNQVQSMIDDGALKENEDGGFTAVLDPAESEYLRAQAAASKRRPMGEAEIDRINEDLLRME